MGEFLRKRNPLLDGRMAMEDEFNPGVGPAFREVECSELFHAGNEGSAGRYGSESVGVRLALQGSRE